MQYLIEGVVCPSSPELIHMGWGTGLKEQKPGRFLLVRNEKGHRQ
jgi:hypothetical protein